MMNNTIAANPRSLQLAIGLRDMDASLRLRTKSPDGGENLSRWVGVTSENIVSLAQSATAIRRNSAAGTRVDCFDEDGNTVRLPDVVKAEFRVSSPMIKDPLWLDASSEALVALDRRLAKRKTSDGDLTVEHRVTVRADGEDHAVEFIDHSVIRAQRARQALGDLRPKCSKNDAGAARLGGPQ